MANNDNLDDVYDLFKELDSPRDNDLLRRRKSNGNPKFLQDEIEITSKIYSFAKTLSDLKLCSSASGLFFIIYGEKIIIDFSNLHEAKKHYIKMVIGDIR